MIKSKFKHIIAASLLFSFCVSLKAEFKLGDPSIATNTLSEMKFFEPLQYPPVDNPVYKDVDFSEEGIKNAFSNTGTYLAFNGKNAISWERRKVNLTNASTATLFVLGQMTEMILVRKIKELAKTGTLNAYEALISKLPEKTQGVYRNLTDKVDDTINSAIEKVYGIDKKPHDRNFNDKLKILAKRLFVRYSRTALYSLCIYTLRAAIHSELDKDSAPDLVMAAALSPIYLGYKTNYPKFYAAANIFSQINEEVNYAFLTTDIANDEQLEVAEEHVKLYELIDPAQGKLLRGQFEQFKIALQEAANTKPSALRSIGNFILDVIIGTAVVEGQCAVSDGIKAKWPGLFIQPKHD